VKGENTHSETKQESLSHPIPQEWVDEIARRAAEMVAQARRSEAEPWITVQTAAEHIGCARDRVYALVRQQAIPHEKDGRRLLFRRSDLDSYIRAGGAVREKYPGLRERVG
jgi:excisionase family DNA binding protein